MEKNNKKRKVNNSKYRHDEYNKRQRNTISINLFGISLEADIDNVRRNYKRYINEDY